MSAINSLDSAVIDGLLAGCGISPLDVAPDDPGGLRFTCFAGPSTVDAGGLAEAEAALIRAGFVPSFAWETEAAAAQGWGRCLYTVA